MAIHPIEFRYGTEEMREIWETDNKLQKMLEVEAALAEAEAQLNMIPREAADEINPKQALNTLLQREFPKLKQKPTMILLQLSKALVRSM